MAGRALRHFYRDTSAHERAKRETRVRAHVASGAKAGLTGACWLGLFVHWLDTFVGLDGAGWTALTFILIVAYLGFAAWYLAEVLSRRRAAKRRHRDCSCAACFSTVAAR